MLIDKNFTKENIERLRIISGNDPSLLEKAIYAFGLLEALAKVNMPFIFKGGTCLMLLLDNPKRLSTDIDIIVEPGTDVLKYIEQAGKLFPFVSYEEDVRKGRNNIEKRHFEFSYHSPINNKTLVILLDILFEKNNYKTLLDKPIKNNLLLTEGVDYTVKIPNVNSILGDKLTAFAPHTTGIPFGVDKDLEIIKQLYDCYTLSTLLTDFSEVCEVYNKVAKTELRYRGKNIDIKEVLRDTIKSCFCIISKGAFFNEDYSYFLNGIRRIAGHIYNDTFNGDSAAYIACEVLYLASCIFSNSEYKNILEYDSYINETLDIEGARSINYLRKVNIRSYAYLFESIKLLNKDINDLLLENV